ncbi:unnamed protein product, partial [Didymodactylos carnosus]
VSIITSSISLIISIILDFVYDIVATYMTEVERHRLQTHYDASLTLKLFIFAFINYYGTIIYTAFFKPLISNYPGPGTDTNLVFTEQLETCGELTGCAYEVTISLLITLIGKQLANTIVEYFDTKITNILVYFRYHKNELSKNEFELRTPSSIENDNENLINDDHSHHINLFKTDKLNEHREWETDIYLQHFGRNQLYNEYIEIMIQYGFIAMFSCALPVAPLLAMGSNLFEIRTDGAKLLFDLRRPYGDLATGLGIWDAIFDAISKIALLTNILYLTITCDLLTKIKYINTIHKQNLI